MRRRPARTRGFTLIELMVVVAIIGLLSSIAIPSFRNMQLRSKQTERTVMMTSIRRSIDDYYVREGRYPLFDAAASTSWMYLFYWNPNSTPNTQKRPWRQTPLNVYDHWSTLSLLVEGAVYYSYYGYAYEYPQFRYTYLQTLGDLDGDGVQDRLERYWYYEGTRLVRYDWYHCSDCTYEFRSPEQGAF